MKLGQNKIHIALITTWFPPEIGVAVQRMVSFKEYLTTETSKVSVFTIADSKTNVFINEFENVYREKNTCLFKPIKEKISDSKFLHYSKVLYNILLTKVISNEYKNWSKKILVKLNEINKNEKIDIIISSFAPSVTHEVAFKFKSRNPAVKWIVDMRDEMSFNPDISNKLKFEYEKIERKINDNADAFISVSKPIIEKYKPIFNNIKCFEEIRNGFNHSVKPKIKFNEIFTIVYSGTFYGKSKPDFFFKALELLINDKLIDNFKINFIGTYNNFYIPENIKKHISFLGYCDNKNLIYSLLDADALLLILPNNNRVGVYSGKIFEYISVKKPIIAILNKEDVAAALINEYKAGYCANYNDIDEIKNSILFAYNIWKNREQIGLSSEEIYKLHRKYQIEKLLKLVYSLNSEI